MKRISPFYPHTTHLLPWFQLWGKCWGWWNLGRRCGGPWEPSCLFRQTSLCTSTAKQFIWSVFSSQGIKISSSFYIKNHHTPSVKTHSCKICSKAIFSWAVHATKRCADLTNLTPPSLQLQACRLLVTISASLSLPEHSKCQMMHDAIQATAQSLLQSRADTRGAAHIRLRKVESKHSIPCHAHAQPQNDQIKSTHKGVN